MKYAYIEELRQAYPVSALCKAMDVSHATFYAWLRRPPSLRSRTDLLLRAELRRLHAQHRWSAGAVKAWKLLNAEGISCGKHRVRRLRRAEGLVPTRCKRIRVKRAKDRSEPPLPDLVCRHFNVDRPNQVWVGDITSLRTREGWVHLAIVLDLYARRIIGWATDTTIRWELPMAALEMAVAQRQPPGKLIFHSDQGAVYTSSNYRRFMDEHAITPSMSRKGNCHDNAVAESFFSNLKNEAIQERVPATRDEAMAVIKDYIEVYYNQMRLHQTLGYRTPAEVEMQFGVPN